eukprot:scaffold145527_cov20-Tisochrysis_lutea.AAC.1
MALASELIIPSMLLALSWLQAKQKFCLPDSAVCARACTKGQTAFTALVGRDIVGPRWHVCKPGVGHRVCLGKQGELKCFACAPHELLKGHIRCERAITNWAVLSVYGHVPLHVYCFKSAVKMYNGLLNSNS